MRVDGGCPLERTENPGIETNTRFGIGIGGSGRGWWNSGHAGNTGALMGGTKGGFSGGEYGCSLRWRMR
jgi:hypothetical protein